jgi:hypothetical protein
MSHVFITVSGNDGGRVELVVGVGSFSLQITTVSHTEITNAVQTNRFFRQQASNMLFKPLF